LPWTEDSLTQRGHAIECRIYAEDPAGFLPQAGPLLRYREPAGPGIRVDAGVVEGGEVSVHYDPMLAKLIVSGESRAAAIERAVAALRQYVVLGVRSNVSFLRRVLESDAFRAGDLATGFLDAHPELATAEPDPAVRQAALAVAAVHSSRSVAAAASRPSGVAVPDPWSDLRGWRS
jgi:acetyl/propionyl-CoA carboxylase alpha subunit